MSCGVCNKSCKGKYQKEGVYLCYHCTKIYLAFGFTL